MKRFNHTFAVCAYKESPYLDNCIASLKNQTIKSKIEIYTSTPNEMIYSVAKKYNVPVYVIEDPKGMQSDWNYAYNHATTNYVTVAHQDDEYHPDYLMGLVKATRKYKDWLIYFPDYHPIKNGDKSRRDVNSHIRRFLRLPIKIKSIADKKFIKEGILRFGNTIVCPLVTYNKKKIGDTVFTSDLKFNMDWDTFYKLSQMDGRFLYVDKVLGYYRVHQEAATMGFINNHSRETEDLAMFLKFWPPIIARFILTFYKLAYKTYG